jgi:branched-chain amino acid transport system ATP-binding protein
MALLEVEGVSRYFGGVAAVRDVSFAVEAGEIVGVMGPNGSGKTTLFNLITGALAPDAGRVRIGGEDVIGLPPHRICAKGIARTFQLVHPFPGLTALENVLVGQLYGRKRLPFSRAVAEAERLLATVGLGGKGHLPAAQLTVVDRKRLELARALATAPRVLLMDEFMAGLTPAEAGQAIALIRTLQGQGVTLVIVEHIVWALLDLSHRIVVLSAGEKIAEGPPAVVARDPTVMDVYLGTAAGA